MHSNPLVCSASLYCKMYCSTAKSQILAQAQHTKACGWNITVRLHLVRSESDCSVCEPDRWAERRRDALLKHSDKIPSQCPLAAYEQEAILQTDKKMEVVMHTGPETWLFPKACLQSTLLPNEMDHYDRRCTTQGAHKVFVNVFFPFFTNFWL